MNLSMHRPIRKLEMRTPDGSFRQELKPETTEGPCDECESYALCSSEGLACKAYKAYSSSRGVNQPRDYWVGRGKVPCFNINDLD